MISTSILSSLQLTKKIAFLLDSKMQTKSHCQLCFLFCQFYYKIKCQLLCWQNTCLRNVFHETKGIRERLSTLFIYTFYCCHSPSFMAFNYFFFPCFFLSFCSVYRLATHWISIQKAVLQLRCFAERKVIKLKRM